MIKSYRKGNKEEKEKKNIGPNGPMVWSKTWSTRPGPTWLD
jgi:hypothetical protein